MPEINHPTEESTKETGETGSTLVEQTGAAQYTPMTEEQLRASQVGELVPLSGPIHLVDYDQEWPGLFEREAERVRAALGDRVLLLEHVGSTSVPQLAAKPRIDMLLAVADSADEPAYVPPLEAAGYVLKVREPDWYEHRMFKGPDTDISPSPFSRPVRRDRPRFLFPATFGHPPPPPPFLPTQPGGCLPALEEPQTKPNPRPGRGVGEERSAGAMNFNPHYLDRPAAAYQPYSASTHLASLPALTAPPKGHKLS